VATAESRIKIVIAGAGGLGTFFGGRLSVHADVTLVARGERLESLRSQGVVIHIDGDCETSSPALVDSGSDADLATLAGADYVLFACKTQHTEELAQQLLPFIDNATQIVSLQNGVDNEIILEQQFGRPIIGAMTVRFGSHLNPAGEIEVIGELITRVGDYPTGLSARLKPLVKVLKLAGFDASAVADIRLESWKKMVINCACNPISALQFGDIQTLYKTPSSRWVMQNMMREAAAAAAADGVEITPGDLEQLSAALVAMPPLRSSMQVDAERGTPLELAGLTGAIMHRSAALGQEALVTSTVHHLLLSRYPNAAV